MSSLAPSEPSFSVPPGVALGLAALGPAALGAILATRAADATPVVLAPVIVFGVVAATSPALYIATAALGDAPPLARVARAFVAALGGFGLALAGLVLPAAFLALSSLSQATAIVAVTAALGGAALLGLRRLATELAMPSFLSMVVFLVWAAATLGIAGRFWLDVVGEVVSC
jgi:hypothetical protein